MPGASMVTMTSPAVISITNRVRVQQLTSLAQSPASWETTTAATG